MTRTCVVLAGGLGSRMSHFTKEIPKALIPVAGVPFVHHQLNLLEKQGFTDIIFSIGYLGNLISAELIQHPHRNLEISFVEDGDTLLGTGGAVRKIAEECIQEEIFFVTYGDSYLEMDISSFESNFDKEKFLAQMSLYNNQEGLDKNNASLLDDGSVRYQKGVANPEEFGLDKVDHGMLVLTRGSLMDSIPSNVFYDLATYLESISAKGFLQGYLVNKRFYEIGSIDGLAQLEGRLQNTEV